MPRDARFALLLAFSVLAVVPGCSKEKTFLQPNSAMEPAIRLDEEFAADFKAFRTTEPAPSDVVVFEHDGFLIVKRVVAVAGDVVEGRGNDVSVNHKRLNERYAIHSGKHPGGFGFDYLHSFGPVTVPKAHVFVLGDNRDFSHDSRDPTFGPVPVSSIRGRATRITDSPTPGRVGTAIE